MGPREKTQGKERIAGLVIVGSLFLLGLSMIGIRLIDANVTNIELVDRELYAIITDRGTANVNLDDVIRIERTYTKAAVTGTPVELDKIYTKQGFIYVSSLDSFGKTAQQLIKSVDYYGEKVWERPGYTGVKAVRPYTYAIGTPAPVLPVLAFILYFQSLILTAGGVTLIGLIIPVSMSTGPQLPVKASAPGEIEYCPGEEQLGVVAK